jgi:hypothetical protein
VVAVVHLVWGPLGPAPLRSFLKTYRGHAPGLEHELVMLFNGVTEGQRPALMRELEGPECRVVDLPDPVQDLVAYAQAAERLENERLCFLNSYSEILVDGWLAAFARALDRPAAGMVGATGSWASFHSGVLNSLLLPNPYRGVVPERSVALKQLQEIELELSGGTRRSLARSVLATLRTLPPMPERLLRFEGFPAEHLRTNAFMVERALFSELRIPAFSKKKDAYALESGRHSITRQVQRLGLRTSVVARDGAVYEPRDWPRSYTLWQGDQEGLMVADNQTRSYANGGLDRRRLLATYAWGSEADPRVAAGASSV